MMVAAGGGGWWWCRKSRNSTHELLVVHGLDGGVSLSLLGEGDEAETARAASSGLGHDNAVDNLSEPMVQKEGIG